MGKPLCVGVKDDPGVGAQVKEHVVCCLGYGEGPVVAAMDGSGLGAQVKVWV